MNKILFIILLVVTCCYAQAQSNSNQDDAAKNNRTNNIIKKNLEAIQEPAEEIEKIIIQGQRDPENLPNKKKTIKQIFDAVLPEIDDGAQTTIVTNANGTRRECVKRCSGPMCCTTSTGASNYTMPDSVHK